MYIHLNIKDFRPQLLPQHYESIYFKCFATRMTCPY